jgi:Protein of unknown function (DUF559)
MPNKVDTTDARLAEFANSQHGLVATKQLMAAGIGRAGSVAFHEDRARDLDLRGAGFTVLRFDERQLEEEPERVAADVAAALRAPAAVSVHRRG